MAYIGELVQELRKDCGWTQRELAEKLGVHPSQVSRLERGTTKDVGIELVLKLAEVFEVSTDYLLGRSKVREVQNHMPRISSKLLCVPRKQFMIISGRRKHS